jgi:ketosteroid isomerase-like protein
MKFKAISILMLSMIFIIVSCEDESQPLGSSFDMQNSEPQALSKNWQQSAEDLNAKFLAAIADHDIDAFMSCIWNSPEALLVLEHGIIVRGWDNIKGGVTGLMASHANLDLEINRISRFRFGNVVYSVGQATWTRTGGPAPDESFQEVWTDITRKVNGKWVVIVNHPHWVGNVGDPWPPWVEAL